MIFRRLGALLVGTAALCAGPALGGPPFQPPGANLTLGNLSHTLPVQGAMGNPAAASAWPADAARGSNRGTGFTGSAGLEYGNLDNIFEFYDRITGGYTPSDPDDGGGGDPGDGDDDDGIDLGEIWDRLDPDIQDAVTSVAEEIATQAALLALVSEEGYGKAWLTADLPWLTGYDGLGGTWTARLNWSGASRAFGLAEGISFDTDAARMALEDWFDTLPIDRPEVFPIDDQVELIVDPETNSVAMRIANDSSIVTKSTQTTQLSVGYSRPTWSFGGGTLHVGTTANLYFMQLSRASVRFGDVTDSKELFDEIRNADFTSDTRFGLDVGALWVGRNVQLGAQVTNLNEPEFAFPGVDLSPYSAPDIIDFLERDRVYTMDRQLTVEASVFDEKRRWSAHLGYEVDPVTDPLGDRFQWLTASAAFTTDAWWLPSLRAGYRENLAGTGLSYVTAGATLFKYVNLDLASAFDTVRIEGRDLPQGVMVSLGFQIGW
ncbi:MAG: conjugal transfer protein TraF [Pseudomonadota bacterium]